MNGENGTNKKKVIKIKIKPKSSMTTQTLEKEEPPTTVDAAPAAAAETSTSTYKIETCDYTIINCCCIKGLTTMKDENKKIHLTVTSPPYYNVKDYVNYADYKDYLSTLRTVFTLNTPTFPAARTRARIFQEIITIHDSNKNVESDLAVGWIFL
jgi:hypothetical protein